MTMILWHRGTAAPLVQKRHRYLCSTCTNQMLVRLANKYFFNIILPLFPLASPGFGCRCRGDLSLFVMQGLVPSLELWAPEEEEQ